MTFITHVYNTCACVTAHNILYNYAIIAAKRRTIKLVQNVLTNLHN